MDFFGIDFGSLRLKASGDDESDEEAWPREATLPLHPVSTSSHPATAEARGAAGRAVATASLPATHRPTSLGPPAASRGAGPALAAARSEIEADASASQTSEPSPSSAPPSKPATPRRAAFHDAWRASDLSSLAPIPLPLAPSAPAVQSRDATRGARSLTDGSPVGRNPYVPTQSNPTLQSREAADDVWRAFDAPTSTDLVARSDSTGGSTVPSIPIVKAVQDPSAHEHPSVTAGTVVPFPETKRRRVSTLCVMAAAHAQVAADQVIPYNGSSWKSSIKPSAPSAVVKYHHGENAADHVLNVRGVACNARFHLGFKVDLDTLARRVPNTELQRNVGRVCVRAFRDPRWTAVVTANGFVHVYTCYDGDEARTAAKRVARLLQQRYSKDVHFRRYEVCNILAIARVPFRVNVAALAAQYRDVGDIGASDCPDIASISAEVDRSRPRAYVVVGSDRIRVEVQQSGVLHVRRCSSVDQAVSAMKALVPHLARCSMWW